MTDKTVYTMAAGHNLLKSIGFSFADSRGYKRYYKRTDGQADIFYDHSATLTQISAQGWVISNFIDRRGEVK